MVKCLSTIRETLVWSHGWADPLEKEMAIHSSTIAWKIPWTEEPGRLQSMGHKELEMTEQLHFTSLGNKEFMIWATVSSRSCFCWLYRVSPSLAAKNIINLISMLTIWWCPCVVFSCAIGRGCFLWSVHSLGKTLLAFALLHFVLQGQTCLLLQVSLDFLLLHSSPL